MIAQTSPRATAYVGSINRRDSAAFLSLFADGAVVNDAGREFQGGAAIEEWSQRDIFDARITLDVIAVADRDGETVVTTVVDGDFDRIGLPDPVVIDHRLTIDDEKIVRLTCQLAA